jgi:hypothetical protein
VAEVPCDRSRAAAGSAVNELLLWMSVRGSGSRSSFRAKVAELGDGRTRIAAAHRLAEWDLSRLGHAEFEPDADEAGWRIAPPVLAAGDYIGPWRGIMCGARTPSLAAALSDGAAECEVRQRAQPTGPDVIEVVAQSAHALAEVGLISGIAVQWNASLAMLATCPPLQTVLQLVPMPVGGWTVARFSKSELAWVPSSSTEASAANSGLFRFAAEQQPTAYILVEGGLPHSCDAAGGKYSMLSRRNRAQRRRKPILSFDAHTLELAVRASCRPPPLVERALVLCSGELPVFRDRHLVYSGVDRCVADATAAFLGLRLS